MQGVNNVKRRDWFRILRDLSAAGVSYANVASKCNRNASTVRQWAEGADPKETDARIVLALYAKHCPLKYIDHQREFSIRVEMQNVTGEGENFGLPFAED